METMLLVGLGGFIGANARYLISTWAAEQFGRLFPWGTLIINVSGSMLLAAFLAWAANRTALDPRVRLFLAVGFFGAYTTFSTFANESIALVQAGDWVGAVANVLGTNAACLMGVFVGLAVGARL